MSRRGRRKSRIEESKEIAPLKGQNILVRGRRTSMRLEPLMWEALDEIGRRENMSVNDLCGRIEERRDEQCARKGITPEESGVTLTAAVRVFIAAYFRRASTETGHSTAGHGTGDPFVGTPFDLPPEDDGDGSSAAGGGTPPDDTPPFGGKDSKSADGAATVTGA